ARATRPGGAHPGPPAALVGRGRGFRGGGRRGGQTRKEPALPVTAPPAGGLGPAAAGGKASSVVPPGASRTNPLQAFYAAPGLRRRAGRRGARREARMLAEVLRGVTGPAVIIDVGCGDGSALAVAAGHNPGHRFAGIDWSCDALRQARALGLEVLRGGMA